MATIRKRNGKWQVQVRRKGCPTQTRSFSSKADAQAWARQTEADADRRGMPINLRVLDSMTVGDLIARYRDTVTPAKRGAIRETVALNLFLRHRLAKLSLTALTSAQVAQYRDERLERVKPSSFNRELAIYRHAFEVARRDWNIPLPSNPFAQIGKPKTCDARSRRLQPGEWEKLQAACQRSRNPFIRDMVEFALETAMRRGEVLNVRWRDVDPTKRILRIPMTKNGHPRTIPLTHRALEILISQRSGHTTAVDRVFPTTEDAIKMAWRRVMSRTNLSDFRYHDLRHEAISRFFELGLSVPEVAHISGHRDLRMLGRYTHLRAEDIARKLAAEFTSDTR